MIWIRDRLDRTGMMGCSIRFVAQLGGLDARMGVRERKGLGEFEDLGYSTGGDRSMHTLADHRYRIP